MKSFGVFFAIIFFSLETVLSLPQLNATTLTISSNLLGVNPAPTLASHPSLLTSNTSLLANNPNLFKNAQTLPPLNLDPQQSIGDAHPCTCGVFMSGQFEKGSTDQPTGYPALIQELPQAFPCNPVGLKTCVNKCLEAIIKHLPNSENIICATAGRDCHKERAHLFVQNCDTTWINSNLSAGREYCCKDNVPYKCPLI